MTATRTLAQNALRRQVATLQPWRITAQLTDGLATTPLYAVDGHQVTLNLHAGQLAAWASEKRFVFMLAGTQGGKTSYLPLLLLREIFKHRFIGDYIAATSTYKLFSRKFLPVMLELFEHVLKIGRYWGKDQIIELINPDTGKFQADKSTAPMYGRILLGSAQAAGSLESATAKAAILDECGQDEFKLIAYEAVLRRLSLAQGRVFGGTTIYNLGWIRQQIYDPFRRHAPDIDVIQFASSINPAFPVEEMERAQRTLPTWKFLMFYKGEFSRPPGLIYEDFIDDYKEHGGHKVRHFAIPQEWLRIVAVDPGIVNQAIGWYAYDNANDIWYKYREQKVPRKPQAEHAQDALALAKSEGIQVVKYAIGAPSEKYHREDWIKAGARGVVEPPTAEVEKGIDSVIALFKTHRLYIFDGCVETLEQLATYSREVNEQGDSTDKIKDKSTFHFLDEMRYFGLAAKRPNRSTPQVKVKSYV